MNENRTKREVIGMFDRAASLYDQVGTRRFTHFARLLVNRLPILPGMRVLDVACGRGALLFAAAEKIDMSGMAVGIDLAPSMLNETYAEAHRRGLLQTHIALMDGDDPAFSRASFDVILCGFALHFLDFERTLPRCLDLLKPGGWFAASIPHIPQNPEERARWQWLFDLTRAVFPPDFQPPPAWIAPRRLAAPELAEAALTGAGFGDVQTEIHEAVLYFKDEADWWDFEWSQGSRFWLEGMSPEGLARFQRESFLQLAAMNTADGIAMLDGALFVTARRPELAT